MRDMEHSSSYGASSRLCLQAAARPECRCGSPGAPFRALRKPRCSGLRASGNSRRPIPVPMHRVQGRAAWHFCWSSQGGVSASRPLRSNSAHLRGTPGLSLCQGSGRLVTAGSKAIGSRSEAPVVPCQHGRLLSNESGRYDSFDVLPRSEAVVTVEQIIARLLTSMPVCLAGLVRASLELQRCNGQDSRKMREKRATLPLRPATEVGMPRLS
jgi:hypothetical protein